MGEGAGPSTGTAPRRHASSLRVLHVITLSVLGGAPRYVAELARRQRCCGFHVELAIGRRGWLTEQTDCFAEVHEVRHLVREIAPSRDAAALVALTKLMLRGGYDVVHTHSSKAGVLGRMASRLAGAVVTAHTSHGTPLAEPVGPARRTVYWVAEQAAALMTDRLFAVSETERALLRRSIWTRPGALRVMTIVPDHVRALQEAWSFRDEARWHLVAVGNLFFSKGYDVLIRAVADLASAYPRLSLTIHGEGPERPSLEAEISRLGLAERVRLPGRVEDAPAQIARAGSFVMPSRKEGLPFALMEAMALGAPIVATDVGAVGATLGPDIPLARAGDPRDLARVLGRLLSCDDRRVAIARAARTAYERLLEADDPGLTAEMYA